MNIEEECPRISVSQKELHKLIDGDFEGFSEATPLEESEEED